MTKKYTNEQLLQSVCDMYNKLDVSCIKGKLAEDLVYESQWVLTPMVGKEQVYDYLKGKLQTLKNHNIVPDAKIVFPSRLIHGAIIIDEGKELSLIHI